MNRARKMWILLGAIGIIGSSSAIAGISIIQSKKHVEVSKTKNWSILTNEKINASMNLVLENNSQDKYILSIKNNNLNNKNNVTFLDGSHEKKAKIGDEIKIKINNIDNDYVASDLLIYFSDKKNGINTKQIDKTTFSFVLNKKDITNLGLENNNINIEVVLVKKIQGDFDYGNDKEDSEKNSFTLQENLVIDNDANNELTNKINYLNESGWFADSANRTFTIYLNDHELYVKNFDVPKGCELVFINNSHNTGNGIVKGYDNNKGKFLVAGGIVVWSSVTFENIILDSPLYH